LAFAGRGENPSSQSGSQHGCRLSGLIGIQTVDPRSKETLLPAAYRLCRSSQPLLDRAERHTFGQHENQPGTEDISCRKRTRLGDAAEFKLLGFTEYHGIIGHTCLDADRASNVYSATSHYDCTSALHLNFVNCCALSLGNQNPRAAVIWIRLARK
jgi:hypothetical protein